MDELEQRQFRALPVTGTGTGGSRRRERRRRRKLPRINCQQPPRSVRFDDDVEEVIEFHPVLPGTDEVEDARAASWYTAQEYQKIRDEVETTRGLLAAGLSEPERAGYCYRGIEPERSRSRGGTTTMTTTTTTTLRRDSIPELPTRKGERAEAAAKSACV